MPNTQAEKSFQSAVIDTAHLYGWKVAYFKKIRTRSGWLTPVGADGKGWPDLFLCHEQRGIAIAPELKIIRSSTTKEQKDWMRVLNACSVHSVVWTPDDWDIIEAILKP